MWRLESAVQKAENWVWKHLVWESKLQARVHENARSEVDYNFLGLFAAENQLQEYCWAVAWLMIQQTDASDRPDWVGDAGVCSC